MKMFEVTITKRLLVLAEDERQAEMVAGSYEGDEDGDVQVESELTSLDQVPQEWRDSLPYGENEGLTCRQIMTAPETPPPFVDPPEQLRFGFGGA